MAKKRNGFDVLNEKLDRVIDTMATKEDGARLDARIDAVIDVMTKQHLETQRRIAELEQKADDRFAQTMSAIDALTKATADRNLEYSVMAAQLKRYDEWFRILAKKVGVKLP